jgi:hypothetical protein
MAKKTINLGTGELTGDGESIRSAFDKINDNFTETYNDIASINVFSGDYNDLTNKPNLSNYQLVKPVQVVANNTLSIDALNPTVIDINTYSGLHITAPVQGSQPQLSLPDGSVNGQTFFIYIYHSLGSTPSISLTSFNRTTGVPETQSVSYAIQRDGMHLVWAGTGWAIAD